MTLSPFAGSSAWFHRRLLHSAVWKERAEISLHEHPADVRGYASVEITADG